MSNKIFRNLTNEGLICAFSARKDRNMSLSYGDTEDALVNRKKFLEPLGIDYQDLVCAKQIHSHGIKVATDSDRGSGALKYETSVSDTDAFITSCRNIPLSIFTADCLSIFLYDSAGSSIGLVHAGWRSTKENIAAKTIKAMQNNFNSKPSNILVGFGPAMKSCCYEVKKDFKDIFTRGVSYKNERYFLDLAGINKLQVLESGVSLGNIFDNSLCTSCANQELFSYRREGASCGRAISVMMLR